MRDVANRTDRDVASRTARNVAGATGFRSRFRLPFAEIACFPADFPRFPRERVHF
jgi:hypothetical protein